MNIRFHSSVLITNNLEKLKTFYCQLLKQEIEHDFGTCVIFKCGLSVWALLPTHPVAKIAGVTNAGNQRMELCFETENFDEVYDNLKRQHLNLLHDVIEELWGQRTIRFFDPDGNLIELGESILCFVWRLYNSGMNIGEIVSKTSVTEDNVRKYIEEK
jgi:catechol 2,3-dioxygenase-like lactoylglutathione lyase family enzyme